MIKSLYILGAGGFGRELEMYLSRIPAENRDWKLVGFLDDNLDGLEDYPSDFKICGRISDFSFDRNDIVVLAIANPYIKQTIYNNLKGKVEFLTYVDETSIIGKFVDIGKGSVIAPNCIITTNVSLGDCTIMNIGSQVGHDVIVNDFCSFMPNVDLGGNTVIKDRVFIGTNTSVNPSIKVESDIVIGAGSVVVKDLIEKGIYAGNPAKKIK